MAIFDVGMGARQAAGQVRKGQANSAEMGFGLRRWAIARWEGSWPRVGEYSSTSEARARSAAGPSAPPGQASGAGSLAVIFWNLDGCN